MQKETPALYMIYECRSLFHIPLWGLRFDLHTLICVFLGVIANDGQLEVLPLETVYQQ